MTEQTADNLAVEDASYAAARALVVLNAKASTSWLQRQLQVGYNAAARLIERMEKDGVVSKPDHVGRRGVLISVEEEAVRPLGAPLEPVRRSTPATPTALGGGTDNVSAEQLRLLIERIERLEEEKRGISDDIKDVYGEAKSTGFDVKTIRHIIRLRKMEKHHRDESDALIELYRNALGLH